MNDKNKWVYAYLLTPQGLEEKTTLTGSLLKRKIQEYQLLREGIKVLNREINFAEIELGPDFNLLVEAFY